MYTHSVELFDDLIPDDNEAWRCWKLHVQWLRIYLQKSFTPSDIVLMDKLYFEYLTLFHQVSCLPRCPVPRCAALLCTALPPAFHLAWSLAALPCHAAPPCSAPPSRLPVAAPDHPHVPPACRLAWSLAALPCHAAPPCSAPPLPPACRRA
jgi:hypothetical protein